MLLLLCYYYYVIIIIVIIYYYSRKSKKGKVEKDVGRVWEAREATPQSIHNKSKI